MTKVPIDYDRHGHCVVCHEDMYYTQIIDNKPQQRLSPLYGEIEYLLDDGSKMRVAVCNDCKGELKNDEEETTRIMDCVFKGWRHELDKYSHWDNDKKKKYLKEYSKRKIVMRSERLDDDIIQKKLKKFKEKNK